MGAITGDARAMDLAAFDGPYSTIVADPPWRYPRQNKTRRDGRPSRGIGACHHYDQLTVDEIAAMPVAQLAADRCHLYLWATCPRLPQALGVMGSWGFRWSTIAFVYVKMNRARWGRAQHALLKVIEKVCASPDNQLGLLLSFLAWFGPGFYTGSNVELVLLGWRGQPFKHAPGRKASQLVFAPQPERHSAKPNEVQRRIEWMYPDATPRLELFARRPWQGWTVWGNEV